MIYIYNYIERERVEICYTSDFQWFQGAWVNLSRATIGATGTLSHRNLFAQNCSNPCAAGWTHLQYTQILPACNLLSCSFQRPFILCTQLSFQETFNLFCTFCRCFRSSEKKRCTNTLSTMASSKMFKANSVLCGHATTQRASSEPSCCCIRDVQVAWALATATFSCLWIKCQNNQCDWTLLSKMWRDAFK